ncbi:MAG: cytochrome C oxidase subunit IV family protein [Gammaproteobacteria bacterium]|nr:cytochrome C oxidase subunit IV family protein [Gammaproteobacteria bacterium]MCB1922317.1 cytochrome C oxidase subunit IV family protein [Gammaproteobacteria bacterium]
MTSAASKRFLRPCTWVYAALIALTCVTWLIGRLQLSGLSTALLVLALALLKGHLIGDWFMGLRAVRGLWRWAIVIWLIVPGALITLAFVLSYGN